MKKYRIASILMIIHGALMEIGGCLCLIPIFVMGTIYGTALVVGAVGLWNNKMWGFMLSIINCVITMALMMFMLPAGITDGILACSALILISVQYFGNQKIIQE